MKSISRLAQVIFSFLLVASFTLQGFQRAAARDGDGLRIQRNAQTGKVSHIGAAPGRPISLRGAQAPGMRPEERALAMVQAYAADLGVRQANKELKVKKNEAARGRQVTKFQQTYNDIPVLAGELIVNATETGGLLSIDGEIAPDLSLDVKPQVTSEQAQQSALQALAKSRKADIATLQATEPELWIYDARLLHPDGLPAALVWRMEVRSTEPGEALDELVLVDAQRGDIRLNFNQVDTLLAGSPQSDEPRAESPTETPVPPAELPTETVTETALAPTGAQSERAPRPGDVSPHSAATIATEIKTYTMNQSMDDNLLPGTFVCDLSVPDCGDPDANHAEAYGFGTYQFYWDHFGRDSIDGAGMPIIMSVHFGSGWQNAQWWNGQAIFGDGWTTDDIVGHELTHGVTEYASGLFYFYQSGAINESLSDFFGEMYDQSNAQGNDADAKKWMIGEDLSGFPNGIRSMSSPTDHYNPDKMTSSYYDWDLDELDSGGVHSNSGINNKAAYLLVEGGSFNGWTIAPLGAAKTLAIYYEINTNLLTSGADYADLYADLVQACLNLVGGAGITFADCDSVHNAVDATEMNLQPTPGNYNPEATICGPGLVPIDLFYDGFENGIANWTPSNWRWTWDSPYGPYAHTGLHFLYADDSQSIIPAPSDSNMVMKTGVLIPANAYLHFAHAYDFEHYPGDPLWYDGGVLEYSANNGPWTDAGTLMQANGYRASIAPSDGNPLASRSAFVGTSNGYISTRLNLSTLAGKTVKFRWRMGLDRYVAWWGWWIDDVRIYTCQENGAINVTIGGSTVGAYTLPATASIRQSYAVNNGAVGVYSRDGMTNLIAAERVILAGNGQRLSYSELMGLPDAQLDSTYWFGWYDNVNMDTALRFGNVSGSTAHVNVYIHGDLMPGSPFTLRTGQSTRVSFAGVNNGPVKIMSDTPIVAAERLIYAPYGTRTSFTEIMGMPDGQLDTTYWFPWYNNVDLATTLRVTSASGSNAEVSVYIHGNLMPGSPFSLGTGSSSVLSYPGVNDGVVKVVSDFPVVVTEQVVFANGGRNRSLTQMMGLPDNQVESTYWMPWYNNVDLDSALRFGNVSGSTAHVDVYIHGNRMTGSPFTLGVGESTRISFAGINDGVVKIVSDFPIVAAERVIFAPYGSRTSFSELMGLPDAQLDTSYWLPWYNNLELDTALRFGLPY